MAVGVAPHGQLAPTHTVVIGLHPLYLGTAAPHETSLSWTGLEAGLVRFGTSCPALASAWHSWRHSSTGILAPLPG